MPDELAMVSFLIPIPFVNGSEDYRYDAQGTLFVSVSYEEQSGNRPKSVQVFRQQFDGALATLPVVKLTPAVSYLGGRIVIGPSGQGLVRVMNQGRLSRAYPIPGFAPFTRDVRLPLVQPITLDPPWKPYGDPLPSPTVRRMDDGLVVLQGVVRGSGVNELAARICTLPVGYRPDARLTMSCNAGQAWTSAVGRLDILPNGEVLVMTINVNWVSLACVFCAGDQ